MKKIRLFDLSIKGVVQRFYLMMAAVAGFGFLGQFALAAILGFAIAISFILGVSYTDADRESMAKATTRLRVREKTSDLQEAA